MESRGGALITGEAPDAGSGLRCLDHGTALGADHSLVHGDDPTFEVEVAPPERTRLSSAHAGSLQHPKEHSDTLVLGVGRCEEGLDLMRLGGANLCSTLLQPSRRQVGVRARVRKHTAAPPGTSGAARP
jgi:hypothetical protein